MKKIAGFSDRVLYAVDKIKDMRKVDGTFKVLVPWKGLSSNGDSWEPLTTTNEDVPSKVRSCFKDRRMTKLVLEAKKSIKI